MFLTILLGVLVVTSVLGQDDDFGFEIFTSEKPIIYGPNTRRTCGSDGGEEGVCVPKDQCVNGRVVVDGANRLVPRVQDSCYQNEVCCQLPTDTGPVIKPVDSTVDVPVKKPVDQPVKGPDDNQKQRSATTEGCGVRHETGISFRSFGGDSALFGEFNWMVAVFQQGSPEVGSAGRRLFQRRHNHIKNYSHYRRWCLRKERKIYKRQRLAESNTKSPVMQERIKAGAEKYLCGGSLIHPRVVLTAALPVVRAKRLVVRVGEYDLLDNTEFYPYQTIDVESVTRHESFNSARYSHNIALLFLAKEVQPAPNVGYACLPRPTEVPPHATACIATGWGQETMSNNTMVNVLKMLELPIVKKEKCLHQLRAAINPKLVLDSTSICAGGDGIDTCRGDAGSPLVCPYSDGSTRYYQAGVTSFGIDCGGNYVPGLYASVAALRDWIDSKMSEKGYDQTTYTPPS